MSAARSYNPAGGVAGARGWLRDPRAWVLALALALATAAIYAVVLDFEFVAYDDPTYVTKNEFVQQGLSWQTFLWALRSDYDPNRLPLTWLSHLAAFDLFGAAPAGHHAVNAALHVANVLLLFGFLLGATNRLARSALVAALFALHPQHVESVAWVSERKDVLSAFFALLALLAYLRFARRPGAARMGLVALALALSLAAKSMAVTLPFVMLLLDVWPLGRIDLRDWGGPGGVQERLRRSGVLPCLREKLALFALVALAVVSTAASQRIAIVSIEHFPLPQRIASVSLAYAMYLGQAIWPLDLSVLYVHPGREVPLALGALGWLLLIGASVLIVRAAPRAPWAAIGWLWFVGMLVPVIGIVQIGNHIIADRYTYLPLVGLFVIVAWGVPAATGEGRGRAAARCAAGLVLVALCAFRTHQHLPVWHDTISLFEQALRVDERNSVAHALLGLGLATEGRDDEAVEHYVRATELHRRNHTLLLRIARRLRREGEIERPIAILRRELALVPDASNARNELALLLIQQGRPGDAEAELRTLLEHDPDYARGHANLAKLSLLAGRPAEARDTFARALELEPELADAHFGMAQALAALGEPAAAARAAEKAVALSPGHASARALLDALRARPAGAAP